METSCLNVLLSEKSTANGVSKYIEGNSEDDIQISKIFNWKSIYMRNVEKTFCLLLTVFFLILTFLLTYLNWINTEKSYYNSSMPCIYNITMTLLYL